jgi:hypothetical protein
MSQANPEMRNIAQQLIAYELKAGQFSGPKLMPGVLVCDRLRSHLVTLMGLGGFRALLSRAVMLAGTEMAWLHNLQIKTDGTFTGGEESGVKIDSKELIEGQVVLITRLLGLLVAFIGEKLTLGLVREVWPKLPVGKSNFNSEDRNEKTK